MTTTSKFNINDIPPISQDHIVALEANGCRSDNWDHVRIHPDSDLSLFHNIYFKERVTVGYTAKIPERDTGFYNCRIENCSFGNDCFISSVGSKISGATVGDRVHIENVGRIEFEPEAACGAGTEVSVLDETGSRPVHIYPGLSSQLAALMAHRPVWAEEVLLPLIQERLESKPIPTAICDDAIVTDSMIIKNTFIDRKSRIAGARRLVNGAVINHSTTLRDSTYVGSGVDAENFILEDGRIDSGAIVRNCYIGQGASVEKGFTAHDTLFFANATCENGESCAAIAGPYTVTMHKSSLLIGAQYSFMNAGSGTNSSNHMYKLGPVHWGVMQRGVKTASDSYMMWGGRIGAFSLLMGAHKSHPDTSEFPFSYLFSDEKGNTIVIPGIMLRSCGLMRDEKKWPARDARIKKRIPQNDRITFDVLSPFTIGRMMHTLPILETIRKSPVEGKYHIYNGLRIMDSSLDRAEKLYTTAILKYFYDKVGDSPEISDLDIPGDPAEEWIDLGGQIMPVSFMHRVLAAESITEMENILTEAFSGYSKLERIWIMNALTPEWRQQLLEKGAAASKVLDDLADSDRQTYINSLLDYNNRMELK